MHGRFFCENGAVDVHMRSLFLLLPALFVVPTGAEGTVSRKLFSAVVSSPLDVEFGEQVLPSFWPGKL